MPGSCATTVARSTDSGRDQPRPSSGQAIGRVRSAFMAMEALTHARHIKVGGRFYVAQFFDRETGDVLAGPVPDVALDPAATVLGRTADAPALQRLTREQYELVPGDQDYPWPTIRPAPGEEGQAG